VGMGKGTVIITAKYEYECETKVIWVDITVECPQITFQVNPPQGPLTVGEDFLLWAEVFDKDDNNLDASGVTWGLSGGDIDVVELPEDKTGPSIIITAKKPGSVDITATYDDGCQTSPLQETAQITVAEPIVSFLPYPHTIFAGDPPLTLEVEVKTHKGEIIECPSPIEWTFPDGIISLAVLSDDTKAEVAGVETGLAEIVATCEGGSGEANITVLGELVVAIDPDEKTINTGDSLPLTVNVSDDNGNPIPGGCPSDIEWTIPSGGIISFDYTNEIVTGVSEGTATITATCEGVSAQSIITVESGSGSEPPEPFTLYSIDVYPMDATICMDQGLQFSADLYDFYGSFLSGTVTWWSSDNSIANVDTVSGFVVGVTPGWVFIEARSEGVHGTTILNVAPGIQQSGTVTGHRAYWPIYAPVFRFSDYVEGLDYGWSFKFVVGSAQEPGINCYPNSCIVLKDVQDVSEICPNTLRFGYSPAVSYEVGDIVVFEFSEPPDFTAYYAAIRIDAVWSVPPTEGRSWIEWWVNFTWYYYGD